MTYRLPLSHRLRASSTRLARYWSDPEYRLARINDTRAARGKPPVASLDDIGDPKAGRTDARRDSKGRFTRNN